jgi:hypothetical protein
MNKPYPYRFKTEDEFINEFGSNFRSNTRLFSNKNNKECILKGSWISSMDYL